MCETCQHGCWTEIERPHMASLRAARRSEGARPAASQGELICSNRKPGRPPTEVVRWLVPVAAVIGAGRGRVVVVLSEIAALGEARGRDLRDQRESGDKCLHDTSPWFPTVVREFLQRGDPS